MWSFRWTYIKQKLKRKGHPAFHFTMRSDSYSFNMILFCSYILVIGHQQIVGLTLGRTIRVGHGFVLVEILAWRAGEEISHEQK